MIIDKAANRHFRRNPVLKGRGATENPPNRFYRIEYVPEVQNDFDEAAPRTEYYRDASRSIITCNSSPDVYFDTSINPYRGCEHGCIYCYARPTHEYFGLSLGRDFETKIFVKEDAPQLLAEKLASPRWNPQPLAMSGVTDPYQPIERKLRITRRCLEILARFRNPVQIITKSEMITRDIDLLQKLADFDAVSVAITVTTLNGTLARIMEPRAAQPHRRLAAVRKLAAAGIPVGVLVAPVIPGLTDHEIPGILREVKAAGATHAGYILLRLPHGMSGIFENWLEESFPDRKEKVLNRLKALHNGKLYDSEFYKRMRGEGEFAGQIGQLFRVSLKKYGLSERGRELSTAAFRRSKERQLSLF